VRCMENGGEILCDCAPGGEEDRVCGGGGVGNWCWVGGFSGRRGEERER
jgi:hypothetical protein